MSVVLFAVSASVFAEPSNSRNITGLAPEAVERLPGAARLFEVRNASAPPRIRHHAFLPGQVVARFPPKLSDEEIELLAWLAGADRVERLSPLGLFLIYGSPNRRATEKLMESLWESHTAVSIEANYLGELTFVPNDPHHLNGDQWHHEAASTDIDLDSEDAWDITTGSEEVVVAVIDTGVIDHPELFGRRYVNPGEIPGNGLDDDGNGYVDDVSGWNGVDVNNDVNDTTVGHGTWVASVLLANSNNGFQVAGLDHRAKLLPLKALAASTGSHAGLLACLDYLIANPGIARIVNMSLANFPENADLEADLSAVAQSSILIGGSGNNGDGSGQADTGYPESHPDVITVSGTDRGDNLAFFPSNSKTAATGNSVDFSAPAIDIYSASWSDPTNPSAAHFGDGTSFSTPMVSGIATLCLSIWPTMTRSDLLYVLKKFAVDLGAPGWDPEFGWGRVNAHTALVACQNAVIFIDGFETGDLTQWSSSLP